MSTGQRDLALADTPASANDTWFRKTTDLGNAERLADRAQGELLYVHGIGWLYWDGKRWARAAETGHEQRVAKDTVRAIYAEGARANKVTAHTAEDAERQQLAGIGKGLTEWARRSEAAPRIDAMLKLGKSEPRLRGRVSELDAEPDVLNVQNGILDLNTLELRPHAPGERLTKIARTAYHRDTPAPFWEETVKKALPDPKVREYVQMAVGYSIHGSYSEYLFIAHGAGANLKSTFLDAVRYVLGDYADEAPADLLVQRREWGASADSALAGLRGSRFVTTVETEQGKKLAEVLVKQLTGEAKIKAKFMRQDYFTYTNTSAVWLATNHRPYVEGADLGIWRRIRLIPFEITIPEDERIEPETVRAKLRAEAPGILRWIIEGRRKYIAAERKLEMPEVISHATREYREAMDPLREWLDDKVIVDSAGYEAVAKVRQSYEDYARQTGRRTLGAQKFNERLEELGDYVERRRLSVDGKQGWYWVGLRLVHPPFMP